MSWELFHYEIAITAYRAQACAFKKPARAAFDENGIRMVLALSSGSVLMGFLNQV